MTTQATIKTIEPTYSTLHEIVRALIRVEETDQAFLVIGQEARILSGLSAGTHLEIDGSMQVNLLSGDYATLVDHAYVV